VSWQTSSFPNDGKARPQDAYDVDVDPYDGSHLIAGFHEESGLVESTDAGATWSSVQLDSGIAAGTSYYVFFVDTGSPDTTRKTWLMISQGTGGNAGTWRTADAGATWTQVSKNEHNHGDCQLYQADGVVYMAGVYASDGWGVYRSTDFGVTWTHYGQGQKQSTMFGTPNHVYAFSAPLGDTTTTERSDSTGTMWSTWSLNLPDGPKRAAVSYDGTHYIIVGGNWNAGVYRYVEP